MDRFVLMKSLVAVVHEQSFVRAARAQGISRALVSRQIAELERQLGVRLMNRTTRSITLTESGTRYYEFARRVITEIEAEDAAIKGLKEKAEGQLSIISPKWIGILDLGDAISNFALEQPKIRVHLELGGLSDRTHDFIDSGFDIAFHTHYLRDSSIKVRKIATLDFVMCASPEYLEKNGEPGCPADLAQHNCLVHPNDPIWHFSEGSNSIHFKPEDAVFASNTYLILQKAAVRNMGISMLPVRTVADDILQGKLRIVLPDFPIPSRPLYAAFSPGDYTVKKVRLFIDFMAEWFRKHPIENAASTVERQQEKDE